MRRIGKGTRLHAVALACAAAVGFAAGWILRAHPPGPPLSIDADIALPTPARATEVNTRERAGDDRTVRPPAATATAGLDESSPAVDALQAKDLRIPIDGADVANWRGQFGDPREHGGRAHEAVDIMAPRNTPIHAVEDGTIAKLFFSTGGGGNTVYEFDPSGRFCYYYAHLERYADGLAEGQHVDRGDIIGFVGTSGNAPPDRPHLHFAIFELTPERHWWKGQPIDPYLAYER